MLLRLTIRLHGLREGRGRSDLSVGASSTWCVLAFDEAAARSKGGMGGYSEDVGSSEEVWDGVGDAGELGSSPSG